MTSIKVPTQRTRARMEKEVRGVDSENALDAVGMPA